ncbi:class I SAM-dependent methyltransferase [Nitratidesulfovibrio sp. D1]|uniref:class I SAM-dependent methyltransferase n=1 Tax=Nitratidesulfovibrio sp. D1 TaxID=3440151 RepID=UPI003EBA8B31
MYDMEYFEWQRIVGEFGGKANLFKFAEHVKPSDVVLDFGCGGGFLLKNINCRRRIGVEVNHAAAKVAIENGVECYSELDEISDSSIDVVVSNHALEHVHNPFDVLQKMNAKLASNGLLVLVVPCEATTLPFNPNDRNQHIYTWNPQLLGNLAMQVGFDVEEVFPVYHKWPRNYIKLQTKFGWKAFHLLSRLKGRRQKYDFQVKLVARKK